MALGVFIITVAGFCWAPGAGGMPDRSGYRNNAFPNLEADKEAFCL